MKTVSFEVAKRLREEGIEIKSYMNFTKDGHYSIFNKKNNCFAAPTLDEVLERIPKTVIFNRSTFFLEIHARENDWVVVYRASKTATLVRRDYKKLEHACAELLIWLKKNGYMEEER